MTRPPDTFRIRRGLIPLLVARRVMARQKEREDRAARAAPPAAGPPPTNDKPRKRGWRRWFGD